MEEEAERAGSWDEKEAEEELRTALLEGHPLGKWRTQPRTKRRWRMREVWAGERW